MLQKYGTMLTSLHTPIVCVFHVLSTRKSCSGSVEKNTDGAEKPMEVFHSDRNAPVYTGVTGYTQFGLPVIYVKEDRIN